MSSSFSSVANQVAYVIFDMDGTLIDTETIYTKVTNDILGRYGLTMSWETKSGLMGMPALESARYLFNSFPEGSIPADYTPEMYLLERAKLQDAEFRRVRPLRGAEALISKLKEAKTPMAVATGSSLESMAIKTTHLPHLFDHFDPHVLTASSAPIPPATERMKGKPNPDIFLAAARSLGFPVGINEEPANEEERLWRSRGIVFEDAIPGVEAGIRAGMNVVWVPDVELKKLHPTDTKGAKVVLSSLDEFEPAEWGLFL